VYSPALIQSSRYDLPGEADVPIAYKLVEGEDPSIREEERPKLELDELEERPGIMASGGRLIGMVLVSRPVLSREGAPGVH
jgi:hypothetical protein